MCVCVRDCVRAQPRVRYFLPRGTAELFMTAYLGSDEAMAKSLLEHDERVAPLKAPSLAGLPPTTVVSAGLDPLSASNQLLVETLCAVGVDCTSVHVPCVPHGFLSFPAFAADSKRCAQAMDAIECSIRAALHATRGCDGKREVI